MEFISTICGVLFILCCVATPITLIVWLVLQITKNEKKKKAKNVFLCTIGGVVLFSVISMATFKECEHNWETIEKLKATCTEKGSTVKHCTHCYEEQEGDEIPALGHAWKETVKEATCTDQGERVKKCSVCGETTTEVIEAQHKYSETIVSEAKCEIEGEAQLVCSVCGEIQDKSIPATGHNWDEEEILVEPKCEEEGKAKLICTECGINKEEVIASTGHTWVNATCIAPKTCSICNATAGDPIGHTTDAGLCSRCNETVMKQSPVTVVGMRYTIDYVGGVEWTFRIRNNTEKEIKYITFQWSCYNAVGDSIRDEISEKSYVRIKFTGPLAPGETTGSKRNTTLFYNHSYASLKWNEITVEYMDGTTESITEYYEGYYEQ